MSVFADAFEAAGSAFDALYGEPVELRPQVEDDTSEYVDAGADPDRPVRDLVGIFDDAPGVSKVMGSGANTRDNVEVAIDKAQIDFDGALFPTPADLPLAGDVLALTSRAGTPLFKISLVESDQVSRVVCTVVPL